MRRKGSSRCLTGRPIKRTKQTSGPSGFPLPASQTARPQVRGDGRNHRAHSSCVGASTITRTRGSVPEGRTRTRPRPSSSAFSSSTASQSASRPSIARDRRPRRSRARCGSLRDRLPPSRRLIAQGPQGEQRAAIPSPVGVKALSTMWPGLLAAQVPAALLQRLDHVAVADLGRSRPRSRPPPSPGGSRSWSSP